MHAALIAAALLAAAATPTPSPSPSSSPSPSPPPRRLDRIEVRPGPRQGYDIPVSMLTRLGAHTLAEALRFVPGVVVQQYGTTGSLSTVALQGASSTQTLVLLDGRPINEGDTGVTDFSTIPIDAIDHIRVVEGGFSTQYGSAAVGGVVQIFSRRPAQASTTGYVQIGYAGAFTGDVSASVGTPQRGLVMDLATTSAQNTFDYPAFGPIAGGTRSNNDAKISNMDLCACFDVGRLSTALRLGTTSSDVGAPGSTEFGPAFVSQFARQQRVVNRGALDLTYPTSGLSSQIVLFSDGRRLHYYDSTPSFPYDTLVLATDRGFVLQETLAPIAHNTLRVGYASRGDRALFQGSFYAPPQRVATASTTGWSVADTFASGGFEAEAGVRDEHTQGIPATSVPSFSVRQSIGAATLLRASYARAFRAPNLDEQYFPGFGNPNLQPEYAATFDVGITANSGRLSAGATWFGSDTNNLIVNQAIDTMGDFLPFNVGQARVRGFSAQLSDALAHGFNLQASYTGYPVARDLSTAPDINGVVTAGNRLLYRPTATGSLEAWHTLRFGEYGVDLIYVGQRYGDEENHHFIPPYASFGAHVTCDIATGTSLTLRGDNLTGQRVESEYGYPVLGPTLSVRLTVR